MGGTRIAAGDGAPAPAPHPPARAGVRLGLAGGALLVLAAAVGAAASLLVVPGQALGPLRLGVTVRALQQMPAWSRADRVHTSGSATYYQYERQRITVVARDEQVVMLLTTSPQYRTDRAVGVGHPVASAIAAYGTPDGEGRTLWYDTLGLLVVSDGRVIVRLGVYDPKAVVRLILAEERPAHDIALSARLPRPASPAAGGTGRTTIVTVTLRNGGPAAKVLNPNYFVLLDQAGTAYRYDRTTFRQASACRSTVTVRPGEAASCALVFVLPAGASPRSLVFNDGASVGEAHF